MDTSESPVESIFSPYKVKVGSFEGPLDLLLQLIENRKLFINEISLSEVTNEYISQVRTIGNQPLVDTTHFVLVAATLILIKSRSLLPNLSLTVEEEEKIVNLEDRLKLYQSLKNATIFFNNQYGVHILYERQAKEKEVPVFVPSSQISLNSLYLNMREVLSQKNDLEQKPEKLKEINLLRVTTIEEMMNDLEERVKRLASFQFSDIKVLYPDATEKEVKIHAIVSFLALLEMVREGIVDILQNEPFDDMTITDGGFITNNLE